MTNARSKAALSHESKLFTVNTVHEARERTYVFRTQKAARDFKRVKRDKGVSTTPVKPATWGPESP